MMRIGSHWFWCSRTPCKALQAHHLYNLSPYLPDFPATIRTPTPPTKLPPSHPALPALLTPQGETGQSRPAHAARCRASPFPSPHSQSGHGANPLPPSPRLRRGAGPNGSSARPHRSRSRSPRRGRETGRRRKGKRNSPSAATF